MGNGIIVAGFLSQVTEVKYLRYFMKVTYPPLFSGLDKIKST
jgi:hypothetical protein